MDTMAISAISLSELRIWADLVAAMCVLVPSLDAVSFSSHDVPATWLLTGRRAFGEEITLLPSSLSSSSIVPILLNHAVSLRSRPIAIHAAVADPVVGMPLTLL